MCPPVNCGTGPGPMITEDIGNTTVALGREATLRCVVTHLLDYKVWPPSTAPTGAPAPPGAPLPQVAWVHIDRQMILTIGRHVITRIPR